MSQEDEVIFKGVYIWAKWKVVQFNRLDPALNFPIITRTNQTTEYMHFLHVMFILLQTTEKVYFSSTDTSRNVTEQSQMNLTKSAVLPENRTNIDEKDLFEHATETKNNQSERAYVYINQKHNIRKHPWKKLIRPGVSSMIVMSPLSLLSNQPIPCVKCQGSLSPVTTYNSKYQESFLNNGKQGQENFLNVATPDFRISYNENSKKNENVKLNAQIPAPHKVDHRYEYLELLKSPLLRPEHRKEDHEKVTKIVLPLVLPSNSSPFSESIIREYLKKQHTSNMKPTVARQNEMQPNYGFRSAFNLRSHQTNDLSNRPEDLFYLNDEGSRREFEINQDEDKLLDKYLKDTLVEDTLPGLHDPVRTLPACAQEDCTKPRKYAKINNVYFKPHACSCSRHLSINQVDSFISNDRSLRENKRDPNEILPASSELVNYEEMLSEDSNMIKEDTSIIRPPNTTRINNQT